MNFKVLSPIPYLKFIILYEEYIGYKIMGVEKYIKSIYLWFKYFIIQIHYILVYFVFFYSKIFFV